MSGSALSIYPDSAAQRNQWIEHRRGQRNLVDPTRPYACFVEQERFADGSIGSTATVFLSNRECLWRCVMCDLWQNTLPHSVSFGDIPAQIDYALERLPRALQIKLYNSGSFFDPRAIPPADYEAIIDRLRHFDRVIVECHPALVGERCAKFSELLKEIVPHSQLEVAMGLETAHPDVLEQLNKHMTLGQYAQAAERLQRWDISLRSFVLVQPPFMQTEESLYWACRSIDFAFKCGATAVSLLATRSGNGAMEELEASGEFVRPKFRVVEEAQDYGIQLARGRVFVDLWDMQRLQSCVACGPARSARIHEMNLHQVIAERATCRVCGGTT